MNDQNDMMEMADKSSRIIDSFCAALLNTAAVAAEKIELASNISVLRMRMEAFSGVLEIVNAAKKPLMERLEGETNPAMRLMIERQLEMLTEQEIAVLEKASVPGKVAKQLVGTVDKAYRRDGRRFIPVGSLNGHGDGAEIDVKDL